MKAILFLFLFLTPPLFATGEPKNCVTNFQGGENEPAGHDDEVIDADFEVVDSKSQELVNPVQPQVGYVVVGEAEDGTPIMKQVAVNMSVGQPQGGPKNQPKNQHVARRSSAPAHRGSGDEIVNSRLGEILADLTSANPSPEAMQELMSVSIDHGSLADPESLKPWLRKDLHPFAAVFLGNIAVIQGQGELIPDRVWLKIAQALNNSDMEATPDFALIYSKVAADLLIHAHVKDETRDQVLKELRASARDDDDIQVGFRAGVAFLLHGGQSKTVADSLRRHLDNSRLPADLRRLAAQLLNQNGGTLRLGHHRGRIQQLDMPQAARLPQTRALPAPTED